MNIDFKNKTILITGGTRGIGKAIAENFYNAGGDVTVTGTRINRPVFLPREIKYLKLKISPKTNHIEIAKIFNRFKKLDILVNNAGINIIEDVQKIDINNFDKILNLNLKTPLILCKQACKLMKKNGGKIVNIASIWSKLGKKGRASYIASKSGLAGLSRGLAVDLAKDNILVNTVSPGFVETDLTKKSLSTEQLSSIIKEIPLNRIAQTDEIAKLVCFLCSDLNSFITGQNIFIDGGFSIV